LFPILFRLGPLRIYSYGVFVILGFVIGTVVVLYRGKGERVSVSFERLVDLFFYCILSALVGARGLYVLTHLDFYLNKPLAIFNLSEGGLVFYGGLLLAIGVSFIYMKRHRLPIWRIADLVAPSISLGMAFGKVGCFMAGCCYGKETSLPWAVIFRDPNSLARLHTPLHPVQLYESILHLAFTFFLIKKSKKKAFEGEVFWLFLFLYSAARFLTEMVRGDPRGFFFYPLLSISQGIGLFLAFLSIFMLFYLKRLKRGEKVGGCLRNP